METALRSAAIAFTSGFSTTQIAELGDVARNASIALGRNMADSMDRLFRGVAKLEPEILDELGIMVRLDTAVQNYAATLNKSATALTDYERRQAFLNETIKQGEMKYGEIGDQIDPNPYDRLSAALEDLMNSTLKLVNTGLAPFLNLLSSSSGALLGGIILFATTIITTMIPALANMAEGQQQVANTARHMADSQAYADKKAAVMAKKSFIKGDVGGKGAQYKAVTDLKSALARGKAETKDFEKALNKIKNVKKTIDTNAIAAGKQASAAHVQRMAELEALEMQILQVQSAESQRGAGAGASALAGGQAAAAEGGTETLALIGGAGPIAGFKLAKEGFVDFKNEQTQGFKAFQKSWGGGIWKKIGAAATTGFSIAGAAVKFFGSALLNAIPILGQILFFGGMLISVFSKMFSRSTEVSRALDNLEETAAGAAEKVQQLEETNNRLYTSLEKIEDMSIDTAVAVQAITNDMRVQAGILQETRGNIESYSKALADAEKPIGALSGLFSWIGDKIDSAIVKIKEFFQSLAETDWGKWILEKAGVAIEGIENFGKAVGESIGGTQDERKFREAANNIEENIKKMVKAYPELAHVFEKYNPAERYRELAKEGKTFAQARKIVSKEMAAKAGIISTVIETSENIQSLGTTMQEVSKAYSKNAKSILKLNPFDTLRDSVTTFQNTLKQIAETRPDDLVGLIGLEAEKAGVDLNQFGLTAEGLAEQIKNLDEGASIPLVESLDKLAQGTRNNAVEMKKLAADLAKVKKQFQIDKQAREYGLMIKNLRQTGKFEIGIVDSFKEGLKVLETTEQLNADIMTAKDNMIDKEMELELLKLSVFEQAMESNKKGSYQEAVNAVKELIAAKKELNKTDKDKADQDAMMAYLKNKATAGQQGTVAERSETAAAALSDPTVGAAAKLEAMQGALSPIQESLSALGPEGEAISHAMSGILAIGDAFVLMGDDTASAGAKLEAIGGVITAVSAMMAANSRAQIKEIDNQIEAEKKRDGKSKESLAKIAGLEKKKDQMARKAFEQGKKMKIAQAIISTSAAIAGQLGAVPVGPWNVALAAMMGALGMAQVAIIQKQKYQGGDTSGGASVPQMIQVGKRANKVDVSKSQTAGELAYLRGEKGLSSRGVSNFIPTGGAAGLIRNYAAGGVVVGEQGPEVVAPMSPTGYEVIPNDRLGGGTTNANFTINAVDATGVQEVLTNQRGNIISMIREAAHDHGEEFIEAVDTNAYGDASTANTWTGKGGG